MSSTLTDSANLRELIKMKWRVDKTLGYVYTIDKTIDYSDKVGKVYQHIYVMAEHIGRNLEQNECVHHIDRNRANNNLDNLMLMTKSDHLALHAREDRGHVPEDRECPRCKSIFNSSIKSLQVYCSNQCYIDTPRTRFEVSADELRTLVWKYPTTVVAKMFGVSDVAIAKRCKLYGIDKPPRGYWAKVAHSKNLGSSAKHN